MRRLIRELRDRKVIRVGLVYLAAAWVVLQVADIVYPALGLPEWTITLTVALVAVGFPIALALAWAFQLTPEGIRRDPVDAKSKSPSTEAGPTPSVALMPFLDLSPARDNEYFVDGLSEELLLMLANVQGLRVASRTSSFAFKNQPIDIPGVGKKLKVAHVIEGSVRKDGERLRISVKLVSVSTDSPVWTATYDRTLDDVFAIQKDIATQVVRALRGTLKSAELAEGTTADSRAYEYYLRGRGYLVTHGTRQFGFARSMFEKAVDIDPGFVRAWTGLAEAAACLAIYHGGGEETVRAATRASEKAVRLAPDKADVQAARGLAHVASGEFDEAAGAFEKALSLDPERFEALYNYARTCVHQGRLEQAVGLFERAARADPEDYESPLLASSIYEKTGDGKQAERAAREGLANAERHLEDYPDNHRAYDMGACALIKLGETAQAIEWAEKARSLAPSDVGTRYNAACVYARAGEIDKAFECLEDLPIPRSWVENDSDLDSIRDDPRYAQVGRRDDQD